MNEPWERDVIEKTLLAAVTEQRRARRWAIFFRLTWLAVILLVALPLFASWFGNSNDSLPAGGRPHAAVIDINGVINSENDSARKISDGLKNAYKDPNTRGIILRANSPGGSPVLSGMAYDEIRRQKTLHQPGQRRGFDRGAVRRVRFYRRHGKTRHRAPAGDLGPGQRHGRPLQPADTGPGQHAPGAA